MRKLVTGCYAALLVLSAALPAVASQAAPPRYQSSDPSDGETVHKPPDRVEVTFDQPLDESSRLLVKDDCGRRVNGDSTEVDGTTMTTALSKKPSGDYHVEYVAVGLGGVTGRGEGHFTFTAHMGDPCDGRSNNNNNHQHKNKNKNNGHNNNQHKNKNHENRNHENGKHENGNHRNGEHGSGDGQTHAAGGDSTHSDHDAGAGNMSGHDNDDGSNHDGHTGDGEEDPSVAMGDPPGITSNDTSRKLLSRADSGTLLLSLGLCLGLGVLGGAILRTSGAR